MEDPQSSSHLFNSVNAIKMCFKLTNDFQKDQLQVKTLTVNEIGTPKPKEPKKTLEGEFKDLHLNLPVLEVLNHAPVYNAILDKYVESLDLGKMGPRSFKAKCLRKLRIPDYSPCLLKIGLLEEIDHGFGLADGTKSYAVRIVKNVEVRIEKLKLLEDFDVIDMEKDPTTPLLVGRGFLATASAVIYCKRAKIVVGEGVTRSIFGVKEIDLDFMNYHLPGEWEIARDTELNPFKDVLVFRKMVEFLGVIPINLKGNMWESEELIEKKIDWNKSPKEGDESSSLELDLFSEIEEHSEEKTTEIMTKTMKQYMSNTRGNYGSIVVRPKINDKTHFELKGQYLKELRKDTSSGSKHEDANEHIEKVLEIVDLLHIPEVTQDHVMLRVFPMSLTGAESRWTQERKPSEVQLQN
ncbi:MAK10-like protein [Tanacetum coccineum]